MASNRKKSTDSIEFTQEDRPFVLVYGDDNINSLTKAMWTASSSLNISIYKPEDIADLEETALNAVLIILFVEGEEDPHCKVAEILWRNPMVVCDIVGISNDLSLEERIRIMALGFDNMFNMKALDDPRFHKSLRNKIEKGQIRLNNRFQEQEYKRFRAALSASPDAFIVFDNEKKVFFVSEHYKSVYKGHSDFLKRGTPVEEAFRHLSEEQNVFEGDPRYAAFEKFWSQLDGQIEFTLDNGRTWRVKAVPLPEDQGSIVTTTDITDYLKQQRLLEEKSSTLESTLKKEKEASEIQKQFINMVSHEFRTPLTIIDGNAQIIQKRGELLATNELKKRSKSIRSAVSRLLYMMEGVLSSNMLETGQMTILKGPLNLKRLIEELVDEQEQLAPSLMVDVDIDRLPDTLHLDKKVMTLSLTNLLSNAIKFSKDNPEIAIRGHVENDQLFLEVEDNGIGIPEEECEKIFDRYYRSSLSKKLTGSGIGLHLVKGLIELHGGTITVESEEGLGAKFKITLPIDTE